MRIRALIVVAVLLSIAVSTSCIAGSLEEANKLLAAGNFAEAKTAFTALATSQPQNGEAWFGLASALTKLREDPGAIEAYRKAIELKAHVNQANVALARAYARSGNRKDALDAIRSIQPPAPAALAALRQSPEFAEWLNDPEFKSATAPLQPCSGPEFRQFDFWVGDWDVVSANGTPLGKNTITIVHSGCVLQEQWTNAGGGTGSSVNFYDPRSKKWHQFWVDGSATSWVSYDSQGNPATARGGFHDGIMELTSDPATQPLIHATWKLLPDGRVRQAFDQSNDSGKTWTNSFEGFYVRRQQKQ